MRRYLLAVLAFATPVVAVSAQSSAPDSGVRIRITTYGSAEKKGTLVALTPDSVAYQAEFVPGRHAVPLALVSALDVSRGYHPSAHSMFVGAGIGALVGAGLSAAFFAVPYSGDGPPAALAAVVYGPLIVGGGIAIGAFLGLQHQEETWSPLYPTGREASLIVAPEAHGGFAMGVTVPFDVPGNLEEMPADSLSETEPQ